MVAAMLVIVALLLPFGYYWVLWTWPALWVKWCGCGVDPSHKMAQVSIFLKILQLLALFSTATPVWPPWYCILLIFLGQWLNFRVYQLLGEDGVYYGVRFGKNIPWVEKFPFGYLSDPQYVGSILSLLGCLCWVPWKFIAWWCAGYLVMILVERKEDPSTRCRSL